MQIFFYLACVAARPVLRTLPIAMPMAGAALCALILLYNLYAPQPYTVPMLSKIAATLPAVFLGQIIYLGWARLADCRWIVVAGLAQVEVIRLATDFRVYWAGDHYLWTIRRRHRVRRAGGPIRRCPRRTGPSCGGPRRAVTRSTCVHTLILYRVYEHTVGSFGETGAVIAFPRGDGAGGGGAVPVGGGPRDAVGDRPRRADAQTVGARPGDHAGTARSIESCLGTTSFWVEQPLSP